MNNCSFLGKETEFLSLVGLVTPNDLKPCPSKIEAINKVPILGTVKQIKPFYVQLGTVENS